jgi:pimeloyl-ACP methyl ester carboxylesterase
MKDIAFREFDFWNKDLTNKSVVKLDNVGHYPHEGATDIFNEEIKNASALHITKHFYLVY